MFDFVKNAVVESLDTVPEKYRGLYAENKDTKKFEIAEGARGLVADYSGAITTLTKTKKDLTDSNAESASRRVSQAALTDFLKSQGVETINAENPIESLGTFVGELVDANKKGKEVKVNMDKIKQEAETRIAAVTTAKDAELAKMGGSLKKYMIGEATARELAAAKGNVAVLMPHVVGAAKVVADGDSYVVRVVDAAGDMRMNGSGQPMTISDLVAEMKGNKDFAANFESDNAAGNGTKPNSNTKVPAAQNKNGETRTPAEKIAAGLKAQAGGRR